MTITPKLSMWLNIILAVLGVIAAGAMPSYVPPSLAKDIAETAAIAIAIISAVNGALHGVSAPQPGPMVAQGSAPPKSLLAFLIAASLGLMLAGVSGHGAEARTRHAVPLPPKRPAIVEPVSAAPVGGLPSITQLITSLKSVSIEDLTAADLDAQAQGDRIADQCYAALIGVLAAQQSVDTSSLPKVHLVTTFQQARDFLVALRVGSTLKTQCAPMADEMKSDVMTLVTAIAGGTFSWATVAPLFGL